MLYIQVFVVGPLKENTYILHNKDGESIIIDPGGEEDRIIDYLNEKDLHLKRVLLTHAHFDHVGALNRIYQVYNPQIDLYEADYELYQNIDKQLALFGMPPMIIPEIQTFDSQETQIPAFDEYFNIIHTPGHTRGSVCFYYPKDQILFTGDTLMRECIGRTDLPGAESNKIISSIKKKLFTLDDSITIYPGHMQASTIGHEKKYNPFFQ